MKQQPRETYCSLMFFVAVFLLSIIYSQPSPSMSWGERGGAGLGAASIRLCHGSSERKISLTHTHTHTYIHTHTYTHTHTGKDSYVSMCALQTIIFPHTHTRTHTHTRRYYEGWWKGVCAELRTCVHQ